MNKREHAIMRNLRSFDMNLLAGLDALVAERNVTRAAIRLGLSQPAASNMLRRLRDLFQDELLVRTPTGMSPTERALELQAELKPILSRIQGIFESSSHFDPRTSRGNIRVRMSDLLEVLLLPRVAARLATVAPGVSLTVVHLSPQETVDALEREHIDVAVSTGLTHPSSIRSRPLSRDRLVCVMRKQHPCAGKPMTVGRFTAERHIRVSLSSTDERFVEGALRRMKVSRKVVLHVQHWTVVEEILRQNDLLCAMPESFARRLGPGFHICKLPFASSGFDWELYWHSRVDNRASVHWLLGVLGDCWSQALISPTRHCRVG